MSAAKKRKSTKSDPAWLRRVLFWLFGLMLIVAVVFAAIVGGPFFTWMKLKDRILGSPEYRLAPQQVEITPLPDWIHSDLRGEVFRDPALDGSLSIMDDDLAERIARAFARHPWVAKVVRVQPLHPASVQVELEYRRPVCMIEVPGGLFPVDVEGFLLPGRDFSPSEAARYPRISGVERMPIMPPGNRWPDAKVIGGAEIAAALGPAWEAMRLPRIVPLAADPAVAAVGGVTGGDPSRRKTPRRSVEPFFAIVTSGGTRILWGYAPGAGAIGELTVEEKVARLKRYLADHDTLDGRGGRRQELDVRTMPPSVAR
ncbi:MAG: hypothetical protein K8R46_00370 [Pirellulales bacterium]|nr:hypothetical protein [Pirellulales bacterium]